MNNVNHTKSNVLCIIGGGICYVKVTGVMNMSQNYTISKPVHDFLKMFLQVDV